MVRGVEAVDRQLRERVTPAQIEAARAVLLALTDIKGAGLETGTGRKRPARQLRRFSPIFPVRDLADALAHYSSLGFDAFAYDDVGHYGFADREGVGLHLAADPGHVPAHHASTYLYVRDADALYEEWSRPGIGGRTLPVGPDALQAARGLAHRSGREPDPVRLPRRGVRSRFSVCRLARGRGQAAPLSPVSARRMVMSPKELRTRTSTVSSDGSGRSLASR